MRRGHDTWDWQCASCGYEAVQFDLTINEASSHTLVDEIRREDGLKSLRDRNFRELLQRISLHLSPQSRPFHLWFFLRATLPLLFSKKERVKKCLVPIWQS
jgi:hypothetical protein